MAKKAAPKATPQVFPIVKPLVSPTKALKHLKNTARVAKPSGDKPRGAAGYYD